MLFDKFPLLSSGCLFVLYSGTIWAILVESLMRNFWVKSFESWPASRKISFRDFLIFFLALAAILFSGADLFG